MPRTKERGRGKVGKGFGVPKGAPASPKGIPVLPVDDLEKIRKTV